MPATRWKGVISFGLVNVPVTLHTAVREERISFNQLHEKDHCRIGYKKVCKNTGKEVPPDEIVKGYEYAKGKYAIVTDEEIKEVQESLVTSKAFKIQEFVPEADIDPRFFEKPHYLLPGAEGETGYVLLREALRDTGTVGIGTITMSRRQYLAALKPMGDALVLDLMRYESEVVDEREFKFPEGKVSRQELKMAEQFIKSYTGEFDPGKYRDEYQEKLKELIEAKMKGKKVHMEEAAEPEATPVLDLMARLKDSLEAGGKARRTVKTKKGREKVKKSA